MDQNNLIFDKVVTVHDMATTELFNTLNMNQLHNMSIMNQSLDGKRIRQQGSLILIYGKGELFVDDCTIKDGRGIMALNPPKILHITNSIFSNISHPPMKIDGEYLTPSASSSARVLSENTDIRVSDEEDQLPQHPNIPISTIHTPKHVTSSQYSSSSSSSHQNDQQQLTHDYRIFSILRAA
ncbi:MAG: hypothetical protein EZS28_043826, partial [Streblomastix strix]